MEDITPEGSLRGYPMPTEGLGVAGQGRMFQIEGRAYANARGHEVAQGVLETLWHLEFLKYKF